VPLTQTTATTIGMRAGQIQVSSNAITTNTSIFLTVRDANYPNSVQVSAKLISINAGNFVALVQAQSNAAADPGLQNVDLHWFAVTRR
jgi:hypothetical protein